jgi:glycosyltransferase involved in cell wall biosynthesis
MKKIAILISGMSPGGAENSIINLLEEFAKSYLIRLYIFQNLENEIDIPKFDNLEISRLNASGLIDLNVFLKLRKELESFNLIIAHLFWAQLWTGFVGLFTRAVRTKILWVEQNVYVNRNFWQWQIMKFLAQFIKKVIAVSDEVGRFYFEKTAVRTEIIYNPISLPRDCNVTLASKQGNSISIAFYGRLVTQKNPYLAINSFIQFSHQQASLFETKLNVIGGGNLKPKLVNDFLHRNDIEFMGYLEKCKGLYALGDNQIYLSTSLHEGFQLARFEALKLGLCVVSTRTAGYEYLLNYYKSDSEMKRVGIYFVDGKLPEITNALIELSRGNFWSSKLINERIACTVNLKPEKIAKKFISYLGM